MSQKRSGLGRNLSALLSQSPLQFQAETHLLERTAIEYRPITSLMPGQYQPRRVFSEETISELADSIQKQGLLQPLVVRELMPGQYEIIAGERRWRACQQAGLAQVPVLIRQVNDETALALALVENLQREDLSVLDQARAMQRLLTEFDLTHQQIAELLSKSRTAVSNHLRLLNLTQEVQTYLEQGSLDMGHARCLLALNTEEQNRVAATVVAKALSVRETERLVHAMRIPESVSTKPQPSKLDDGVQPKLDILAQQLRTQVRIKQSAAGSGTLMIAYADLAELDKIIIAISS